MKKLLLLSSVVLFFGIQAAQAVVLCRPFNLSNSHIGCQSCGTVGGTCFGTGWLAANCTEIDCDSTNLDTTQIPNAQEVIAKLDTVDGTTTYYGARDGSPMSPSGGRSIAAMAVLDACWTHGYTDVTGVTDSSGCYAACDNGTKNYACSGLTGADSCYSRCDTAFP